jgi:hypothetical protein
MAVSIADAEPGIVNSSTSAARPIGRSRHEKLAGIQTARGVAALLVVIYHATRELSLPQYLGFIGLGNASGFGRAGVDFFLVLSGFIISYVHHGDVGHPDRLRRYLWRRLTRIYPIFWVILGIECCRALFSPDRSARLEPWHVLQSLLLLPENTEPMIPPGCMDLAARNAVLSGFRLRDHKPTSRPGDRHDWYSPGLQRHGNAVRAYVTGFPAVAISF